MPLKAMPFVRLQDSLLWKGSGGPRRTTPLRVYSGRIPDREIAARRVVKEALENNNEEIRELLGRFMLEFSGQVRASTGIQDENNILCTAWVKFFTRYEYEFRIDVEATGISKRTLRSALQELDSFLAEDYYLRTAPEYVNRTANTILATQRSVEVILQAVRRFLIHKASEVIGEDNDDEGHEYNEEEEEEDSDDDDESSKDDERNEDNEDRATFASLTQSRIVSAPDVDTQLPDGKADSVSTSARLSTGHNVAQGAGPKLEMAPRAGGGAIFELEHGRLNTEKQVAPWLKRKRSESTSKLSIPQNFVQNAKDMEAFCREQEKKIIQLKTAEHETEKLTQSLIGYRSRVEKLEESARSHQCFQEELKKAESEVEEAQKDATTATNTNIELQREVTRLQKLCKVWEVERIDASFEAKNQECSARMAQAQRDDARKELHTAIGLQKAMKNMLMVAGASFTAEAIETAAKAIINGKNPRSVVADMIRDGAV